MEHCCWTSYTQHREAEHNLKSFNVTDGDQDQDTDLESDRMEDSTPARDCGRPFTWWTKYQPKIWPVLEEPHSSKAAKVSCSSLHLTTNIAFTTHCLQQGWLDTVYLGALYYNTGNYFEFSFVTDKVQAKYFGK